MGAQVRPKNRPWRPDEELTTMAAIEYLKVSKTTFIRYVKDGKLTCVNPGEKKARYDVAQLDNMRVILAMHKPQGGRPTNIAKNVDATVDGQLLELVKTGSLGLLQDIVSEEGVSEDQTEAILRKVFTKLAIENNLVEEQIALALHPRPETKQKALEVIFSRILPQLKSQTVIKKTDSVTQRFQEALAAKMDSIRIEMQLARLLPGTTIEGEIIEPRDQMDTELFVPTEHQGQGPATGSTA
jgi:hypothetical protein